MANGLRLHACRHTFAILESLVLPWRASVTASRPGALRALPWIVALTSAIVLTVLVSASAASYADVPKADQPIGYWRLDEAAGATTAADSSGHGNNGTYSGSLTFGAPSALRGDSDPSVTFSGGHVDMGDKFDFANGAAFTLEAWVKPTSGTGERVIFSKKSVVSNKEQGYVLEQLGTGQLVFNLYQNGKSDTVSHALPLNVWSYVAVSYRPPQVIDCYIDPAHCPNPQTIPGALTLYIDGNIVSTIQPSQVTVDEPGHFTVGSFESGSNAWVGGIDEAAVYNDTLTDDQVLAHYVTGLGSIGERRFYRFESQTLDDRMHMHVNVANGNLVLHANDLNLNGTGIDLGLQRHYNSFSAANGDFGAGWVMTPGREVRLVQLNDGSVALIAPSGYELTFLHNADGSYTTPAAADAKLTRNADGTYTLKANKSGEKLNFGSAGGIGGGPITSIVDKNNNKITVNSSNGHLSSIVDTQGRTVTATANANGLVTSITDPAGRVYQYGYDGTGNVDSNLTSYTDPAGKVTSYAYDSVHRLTKITTPLGHVTTIAYDANGRVSSIVRVTSGTTGPTTSFTYNSGNTVVTDPNGHTTTYFYDSQDRVTKVVDALGNTVQASYTGNDDVQTETDANGAVTNFGYDTLNNLTSIGAPTGSTDRFAYTDTAHPYSPTSHTDPQTNSWAYAYDPNDNLSSKSEGAGQNQIKFTYNSNGTLATATNAKGAVTSFGYDANGNLTSINHPAPLGSESFTYDSLSRVVTSTDGDGHRETYTYDSLDRVTRIDYSDGSAISYTYDADGNRTTMVDSTGTTSFAYDALNRLTQETLPGPKTLSYGYDAASNLTTFTDASGTVTYGYDAADRLTSVKEPNTKVTSFGYDKNGNRTSTTYPNGVSLTMTYDSSQRVTSVAAKKGTTTLNSYTYSYAIGTTDTSLRQSVVDNVAGQTTAYTYDTLNRLKTATNPNSSSSYAYDADGNLTSKTVGGVTTTYSYNAADELTGVNGGGGFGYDGNGNLTSSTSYSALAYNVRDQTTSITPSGGSAVGFGYSGPTQALRVSAGGASYVNSLMLGLVSETQSGATTYYTREPDGSIVEERAPGGNYYYVFDGLGSVVALTDGSGNVAATYKYDPFGKQLSSTGTVTNPFRFASYYLDGQTGLYKVGVRYYDASVGRWTQRDVYDDPLEEHGWNRYVYVGDDPINFTDVTGQNLRPYLESCAEGAATGALVAAWSGAGILAGAGEGCAQSVATTFVKRKINRTAGTALEWLGRGKDVKDIIKGGFRRVGGRLIRIHVRIHISFSF